MEPHVSVDAVNKRDILETPMDIQVNGINQFILIGAEILVTHPWLHIIVKLSKVLDSSAQ